jgi:hypothetical protein
VAWNHGELIKKWPGHLCWWSGRRGTGITETHYFDALDEYTAVLEDLPQVEDHDVYAHHTDTDTWEQWPYRQSLWTGGEDPELVGVVSSNDEFYHVIDYAEVLGAVGDAIQQQVADGAINDVHGQVSLASPPYKQSTWIEFEGETTTVYADEDGGDPVELGLRVQSGHSGFHGIKYDAVGEQQVCSNGLVVPVSALRFDQSHSTAFQPGLAYQAVDSVVAGAATVENRMQTAQDRTLMNQEEALLTLLEAGVGEYLDQPVPDLLNAMQDELDDPENPTLWETYNAGTRALTHYSDAPRYVVDDGFDAAATILEAGDGVPDADALGEQTVAARSRELIEGQAAEAYWEGEREAVRELLAAHELSA